jgi:RNA polymerase sigma factor (sigma-70 family)
MATLSPSVPGSASSIEHEWAALNLCAKPQGQGRHDARAQADIDRHLARLIHSMAPRIRSMIRLYGLAAMQDDATQVCALALWRAAESFQPGRAAFATWATWQIRGELKKLRDSLRTHRGDVELEAALPIADDTAEDRATEGAACAMTAQLARRLLDASGRGNGRREGEAGLVMEQLGLPAARAPITLADWNAEQKRQSVRTSLKAMGRAARDLPHLAG